MQVLLIKDVDNLGYSGDICTVASGYARNYLIPRGLAERATPTALKAAAAWREKAEARRAELQAEYRALAERIEDTTLTFTALAGETGKLYGSVTTAEIADRLNETLGTALDRRKFDSAPLRQIGEHKVRIKLDPIFQPMLNVVVVEESEESEDEDEVLAAAVAEAAAAPVAESVPAEDADSDTF